MLRERWTRVSLSVTAASRWPNPGEFRLQPFEQVKLILDRSPPHLAKQFEPVWLRRRGILQPLVAVRAHRPEVFGGIPSAFGLVNNVAHRQPHVLTGMKGVGVSRRQATHLAGVTVALQDKCPRFLGNGTRQNRIAPVRLKEVFAGLKTRPVLVRKNPVTKFIAEFP